MRITSSLLASLLISGSAMAAPTMWISVGDAAFEKLKVIAPQVLARQSAQLTSTEKVHLVEVDEQAMLKLSAAVHTELKRCGGFMVHASETDGRKALAKPAQSLVALVRPSYLIDNQSTVTPILSQLQDSNVAQTIIDLSNYANRYYTTTNGSNASDWIKQKWSTMAAGRSDISVTQFAHSGYNQKSVILTINGTDNASEVVVLGAHMDSINMAGNGETSRSPGADDDASGVASITEALRGLIASGYKPRRTLKFMAYAAEEVGLRGSQDIAANHKANNINVVGVMQLDMTNYKGSVNDIYIYTDYTDSQQNTFMANLVTTYLPTLKIGYDVCGYGCSDHASWNAQGYVASLPFESSFAQYNPYIHSANDTFANSGNQALHALKFARLAAAYAVELGSDGPGVADKVETFTGSLAKSAKANFGPFKVTSGATFKAETTGTGDVDLYVRKTSAPTTTTYTCKSDGGTATESCSFAMTANGDVYVMLNGYTASTYTLKVTYK